jgi:hypothetical protein
VIYLLDTNVVSEETKPAPNAGLTRWLRTVDPVDAALSVVTLAEIRAGILMLAAGRRRDALDRWLSRELLTRFADRILPIDETVALGAAAAIVASRRAGATLSVNDAYVAATAAAHGLTLVTRDERDFRAVRIPLLNPWS